MSSSNESAANIKNPITPRSTVKPPPPPPFWTSAKGQNLVGIVAVVTGCGYAIGETLLHTGLLERYKNVVRLYRNGFPFQLAPNEVVRCQETVSDLRVKFKNPKMLDFFCVFGMDVFHAGSLKLRGGSIIGIPKHFSYTSRDDIDRQDIMVDNKHVEWGSDGGELLQDSLILSERAQKFAIAREIVMTDAYTPWYRGFFGSAAILTYSGITKYVNSKFYGFHRGIFFRFGVYSMTGTLAAGLWTLMNDQWTKYMERRADAKVGEISLDYAKGGVEFYSKILQRNMALRSLMGPNGEKSFTFYGNDVEFIRQRHVPYTERKKKLEDIAEDINNKMKQIKSDLLKESTDEINQ